MSHEPSRELTELHNAAKVLKRIIYTEEVDLVMFRIFDMLEREQRSTGPGRPKQKHRARQAKTKVAVSQSVRMAACGSRALSSSFLSLCFEIAKHTMFYLFQERTAVVVVVVTGGLFGTGQVFFCARLDSTLLGHLPSVPRLR